MRPRPIAWSRPRATALVLALAAAGGLSTRVAPARAADFDAVTGTLHASRDALRSYRFESAQELIDGKLQLVQWGASSGGFPPLTATAATADTLAPLLQQADASGASDAIEGSGYLRLALPNGVGVVDDAFFASIASGRIEVTLWSRAEGSAPAVRVMYGNTDLSNAFQHAQVQAIRTGRETTDGWAEYSTGPVDGMVWGAPIKGIVVIGSPFGGATKARASIDLLEIRAVAGSNQPVTACTQADVDTTCGAAGDCMYGRCVPSSVVWGPMPTQAHRAQLVERWIQIAGRFLGDRAATQAGRTTFAAKARDLARYAVSSRQFFGGMQRLVMQLRDNHTSFGSPPSFFTFFGPGLEASWSAGLDACFGVVEKDLLGGGRGWAVFQAGTAPATGVALKVGDVLTKIDGLDPKAWVDAVYPTVASHYPNDPDADWSWGAKKRKHAPHAQMRYLIT